VLALRYRWFWIAASCVLIAVVVWGSLQTAFSGHALQGFDKVEHFGTYLFLAMWFTGLYRRPQYWRVACGLLALGLSMELGQFVMQAGRMGDPYDLAANTAGIAAGLAVAMLLTGGWAHRVETWLAR
jgi:hypothetical protein